MKIKRVEPDKAPVIVFCCDKMFHEFCNGSRYFIENDEMREAGAGYPIKFCFNCGEKIEVKIPCARDSR